METLTWKEAFLVYKEKDFIPLFFYKEGIFTGFHNIKYNKIKALTQNKPKHKILSTFVYVVYVLGILTALLNPIKLQESMLLVAMGMFMHFILYLVKKAQYLYITDGSNKYKKRVYMTFSDKKMQLYIERLKNGMILKGYAAPILEKDVL